MDWQRNAADISVLCLPKECGPVLMSACSRATAGSSAAMHVMCYRTRMLKHAALPACLPACLLLACTSAHGTWNERAGWLAGLAGLAGWLAGWLADS